MLNCSAQYTNDHNYIPSIILECLKPSVEVSIYTVKMILNFEINKLYYLILESS